MESVDIRQFVSPWPFTVPDIQGPSPCAADLQQQRYPTSYNLNEFAADEASLWWYTFCGGEKDEVGNTLYMRCSCTVANKGYKETREERSRQSCIEMNTEMIIHQVRVYHYYYIVLFLFHSCVGNHNH